MTHGTWTYRRRRATALAVVLAPIAVAALALAPGGRTQDGAPVRPVPVLGPADAQMKLMGTAPAGEPGEAWGLRELPATTPPAVVSGRAVVYGPAPAGSEARQLAFLRHTDATGWQIYDTPVGRDGQPMRGPIPNVASARITPRAGGALIGRDGTRAGGPQTVLLVRDAGGRWSERETPTPGVGGPDAVLLAGESIATDEGAGRTAIAAFDGADRTGLFAGALGPSRESAILRYDGAAFTREPIMLPPDTTTARIVAIEATEPGNAFALLETDAPGANGIELYRRVGAGAAAQWIKLALGPGGAAFRDATAPARGIEGVGSLRGNADPLTVTSRGVWIDGALRVRPAGSTQDAPEQTLTLFYDVDQAGVTGSWCDAQDVSGARVCARDLGAAFDAEVGYRSIAFAGPGFGTRIVTNPLDPGGPAESGRGTYLRFAGEAFERRRGATALQRSTGAFTSVDQGWLEGPVRIAAQGRPQRLRRWPVALRSVLTAGVAQPGTVSGAPGAQALAVGGDGAVARFVPGQGWVREFLLSANGSVSRPRLRGVAWPEAGRAHAVGDLGAMWQWRSDTGLWERDAAAPIGFEAQLMDVAFQPGAPDRGYAVGRAGTLLRYDKTWTQEALPDGFANADLTAVGFAGGQALVAAGGDLLVNDGSGWRVDEQARTLLRSLPGQAQLRVVRGLPDGGAVAGGRDLVIERDGPGAPWRFSDQPLPGQTVVAASPFRAGGRVRALVSVVPRVDYPELNDPAVVDPNLPPPILPAQPLPPDGYVLREGESGWRDEQGTAFEATSSDRPLKSDPVLAFVAGPDGTGWAIGGWGGEQDFAGRGTPVVTDRTRVQTAGVFRYAGGGTPEAPSGQAERPVPQAPGPIRFAVGGHAQCEQPCADRADLDLAPDRLLSAALDQAASMAAQPGGPRFFLNTGGRLTPAPGQRLDRREGARYAELTASRPSLPVYTTPSAADTAGGDASGFTGAFAAAPGPFGQTAPPPGATTAGVPGAGASAGARTHYAFDSGAGPAALRTIVIDNSAGSLAASDPHQNPAEPQLPWLRTVLADAKARGIPSIVVGSRDLSRFAPRLNAATDGDEVAQVLVEGGASAYFFERPEENRALRIPSGGEQTIPAFGTGTLGYRSPLREAAGQDLPVSTFGDKVFLVAELDASRRDAATNRAPIVVRAIPVVDDLSLQAIDGTLLRRSRPSLFQGLARRPESGDRWGEASGEAGPSPAGGDPYTVLPLEQCVSAGCSTRVEPEFTFRSSNPEVGDFVRQDPSSTSLRKPFIDPASDRVVTDNRSGLFCPFNAGTTTVTLEAGGVAFSQQVRVLAGSALRPCGTRPLTERAVATAAPTAPQVGTPELPAAPATPPPAPAIELPPAPAPVAPPPPQAPSRPQARAQPPAPVFEPVPLVPAVSTGLPPAVPPPPVAGFTSTIPPGGVTVRVLEEKREEEAAPEQSQAFSRYDAHEPSLPTGPLTVAAVVLLALAGATARTRLARRDDRQRLATAAAHVPDHPYRRTLR